MRNFLLTGTLLLAASIVSAQKAGESIPRLLDSARSYTFNNYEKTSQFVMEIESLAQHDGARDHAASLVRAYYTLITSSRFFVRLQECKKHLDRSDNLLAQFKDELGPDYLPLLADIKISKAGYLYEIEDYDKALTLLSAVLEEIAGLPRTSENCFRLYNASQYIAIIHRVKGEYESSINQYLAGIPYYECSRNKAYAADYSLVFRNIGRAYLAKKDFKNAKSFLFRARDSLQVFWTKSVNKSAPASSGIVLSETLASYYRELHQTDSCLYAIQNAARYIPFSEPFRGRYFLSLGEAYETMGDLKSANDNFDKTIDFFSKSASGKNVLADAYLAKGRLLEKQGRFDQALGYYQKAMACVVVGFQPSGSENPMLVNVVSKKQLFHALRMKTVLFENLFQKTQDVSDLTQALNTNRLSLALLDSTANEFSLDKDKIILSEQSYSAFEDGIRISNKLYQATRDEKYFANVIALIEKSKGNLLLENLRLVNRFSGIKQEWLEREKELKAEMLLTEQALYEAEASEKESDVQQIRERYAMIKRDYSTLIEQIKREAPDYYKLRFDHSVVTSETIQQQLLKPGEGLIEFFVGDSILAVTGFTNEKKYLKVKPMLSDFADKMNEFRTVLTTGNSDFFARATELYDFLLKDCLAELGSDVKSLTIIPDGLLGYLPFEVLIQSREPKVKFLNDNFAIRYANSATYLLEQMQRKPSESKNFFAGFVSSGSGQTSSAIAARDQKWAPLQGAEHEVKSITELFSSQFTIFNPANKSDFIAQASDYQVLHFAMHSSLNDENPMMSVMVFSEADSSENLLTAIELYSMKLNSELAVLSACNTGVGQLHRGEGIMSFSRAFAYAGVPSAVISLWKVPDIATSKIMVSFYSHLKNGESKDRALQLARQEFVQNNPEMAHPYFWSGFILTGNNSPLSFPQSYYLWWIAIFLVVSIGLFVARKKITVRFSKS